MSLQYKTIKNLEELKNHILTHKPSIYTSSKTSTVIPYDQIAKYIQDDLTIIDLSTIPGVIEINSSGNMLISGAVSWLEAKEFLDKKNLNIMTSPTEELALVLAGVATSCTGERCFSFGNLRSQIISLKYMNYQGEIKTLTQNLINDAKLTAYQESFQPYQDFKNAPFPRLEQEIDLMIGTEGQLGVVIEAELKVIPKKPLKHFFILLPRWEKNLNAHLEISQKIQKHRRHVYLCEFVDANSFTYLPLEDRPNQNKDVMFFELEESYFDTFYEEFLNQLQSIHEEDIFEISEKKFHTLRASIPRAVFEKNAHMGVVKVGTDIQVRVDQFETLLKEYQGLTQTGIEYNLFGHFGDQHLHFNFMPTPRDLVFCQGQFENLYREVSKLNASPFAEHGIGLLKQKYIKNFWSDIQPQTFQYLKKQYDPYNQFFPQGFMGIKL